MFRYLIYGFFLLFCFATNAQTFRKGIVYKETPSTTLNAFSIQEVYQSINDHTGARYDLVYFYEDFVIDSLGTDIPVSIKSHNNNSGFGEEGFALIKYDSLGNYLFYTKFIAYHNGTNYRPITNNTGSPFNAFCSSIGYDNQLTISITYRGADSIDIIDSRKILTKRLYHTLTYDSTLILITKFNDTGILQWGNTISKKNNSQPLAGYWPITRNAASITQDFSGNLALTLDIYELFQPYQDTLVITNNVGNDLPLIISGKDIQLNFNSSGVFTSSFVPYQLAINNTANHTQILHSVSDGVYTYELVKIITTAKDTLISSSPLALDSGESIVLLKRDNSGNIMWNRLVGRGITFGFQLDINSNTNQLLLGFGFDRTTFNFTNPVPVNAVAFYVIYIGIYDISGNLKWQNSFGGFTGEHLISLNFNSTDGGFSLLANSAGPIPFSIGSVLLKKKNTPFTRPFIAYFDSLHQCNEARFFEYKNNNSVAIANGLFFQNLINLNIGNPIHHIKNDRTYITGQFMDSIELSCNNSLVGAPFNTGWLNATDGFVLILDPPLITIDTQICYQFITPSGKYTHDSSGVYYDTLTIAPLVCDSIIRFKLTILRSKSNIDTLISYTYTTPSGKYVFSSDTIFTDTITNAKGCDSLITIKVRSGITRSRIDTSACKYWVVPSLKDTLRLTGIYYDTIPNFKSLDSVITIHFKLLQTTASIDTSVCASFILPSGIDTVHTAGIYNDTIPNTLGCDSILTIRVFIKQTNSRLDTSFCGIYRSPSGKQLTQTITIMDTVPNASGCDSIIEVVFTKTFPQSIISINSCSSFVSPSGKYTYNSNGTYKDTVINSSGCDSIITLNISILPLITTVSKSNNLSCDTPFASLLVTGGNSYRWWPVEGLDKVDIANPVTRSKASIIYYVKVSDTLGCNRNDSIKIEVNRTETLSKLSNVFTPDGDGTNDCLMIESLGKLKAVNFTVVNRWGVEVYSTKAPEDCWNGKDQQGNPVSAGTYFYIIKAVSECDTPIEHHGTITLIR